MILMLSFCGLIEYIEFQLFKNIKRANILFTNKVYALFSINLIDNHKQYY